MEFLDEKKVKLINEKLINRGFNKRTLLNNRGLISAIIEETLKHNDQVTNKINPPVCPKNRIINNASPVIKYKYV